MATSLFKTGSGPLASIVNFYSGGGAASIAGSLTASVSNNCKEFLPGVGSVAANTLSTVINLTGRGRLNIVSAYTKDTTPRTVRCQVIVDGVTVFDATSASLSATGTGMMAIGVLEGSGPSQVFQPIDFNSSAVVKIASSVTETDKIAAGANYELWT